MMLKFEDLPEETRVKLTEKGREDLWHRVDEFGGVKQLSEAFDFSSSKMYNWRSKNSFMPISFIRRLMGQNPPEIDAVKGKGRGKAWGIDLPVEVSEELLTRVEASVTVNRKGTPVYITDEKSLASRFLNLLEEIGVDQSFYNREGRYEVRYSKYAHNVLSDIDFSEKFSALVDEEGDITEEKVRASGKGVSVEEFDAELYSRSKIFDLALARGDKEKIQALIAEESSRVRNLVN
ncbi:hypothetical protein [Candidatus Nanohalovita haloferacivicina]|uniref:hypothetical protein n=1 Tax=Candidatus Nanohalovita haloferacivicina TaxID=2978046 RepID=UPI00325F9919|nr:hypothetical protein HBNXNv_0092 [Candidatus Nanohalobia archaeon BNXNv]